MSFCPAVRRQEAYEQTYDRRPVPDAVAAAVCKNTDDRTADIGIKIHAAGTGAGRDIQFDILHGSEIDIGMARLVPELCVYEKVIKIAEELAGMFPDKEIVDY